MTIGASDLPPGDHSREIIFPEAYKTFLNFIHLERGQEARDRVPAILNAAHPIRPADALKVAVIEQAVEVIDETIAAYAPAPSSPPDVAAIRANLVDNLQRARRESTIDLARYLSMGRVIDGTSEPARMSDRMRP